MTNSNKDKVLVTGVSGYIGAQALDLLLKKGYWVRGTVRSQQKADQVKARYPEYKDKLELVIVEDISEDGAFDHALHDIDGVFHVASPLNFKVTDNKKDLLDPAIKGTTGILETALKFPQVKRVIVTSSFAAIVDITKGNTGYVFTEKDWNPITFEEGLNGDPRTAYCASKKLAEKSVWDFLEAKKPHFDVVTLCPPLVLGPIVHHIDKLSNLNDSTRQFYEVASGIKKVAAPSVNLYVDVRDLALAHLLAYEKPEASNQRFFISNGNYDWQDVVDIAHKFFPNKTKADVGQPGVHPKPVVVGDSSKSVTQLGLVYRTKEETFKDAIAQLIAFEEQGL